MSKKNKNKLPLTFSVNKYDQFVDEKRGKKMMLRQMLMKMMHWFDDIVLIKIRKSPS